MYHKLICPGSHTKDDLPIIKFYEHATINSDRLILALRVIANTIITAEENNSDLKLAWDPWDKFINQLWDDILAYDEEKKNFS